MPAAVSCLGTDLLTPICQGASGVGSALFGTGANAALDALANWVGSGSSWLLNQIGSAMATTTKVSLSAPWFVTRYSAMEGMLAMFALPLLLLAVLHAVLTGQIRLLARAVLVNLPLSMLLAGAAIQLTTMALAVTDQLCALASGTNPSALTSLTDSIAKVLTTSDGTGAPAFIVMISALFVTLAALVLWIELIMRASAIYVAVLFLPLALACTLWPAIAGWCRRLVELLAALILSKLVIVLVLEAAVGALGTTNGRGFATVLTGIALLLLATLAPFTILKLLPLFESSAVVHLEGLRQRGMSSLLHGLPRQGASMALTAMRAAPPLGVPLALATATQPGTSSPSPEPPGDRTTENPMAARAVQRSETAPPPIRPNSQRRIAATITDVQPQWPSGFEDESTTIAERESSPLVIERDELGPLIRPRRGGFA